MPAPKAVFQTLEYLKVRYVDIDDMAMFDSGKFDSFMRFIESVIKDKEGDYHTLRKMYVQAENLKKKKQHFKHMFFAINKAIREAKE